MVSCAKIPCWSFLECINYFSFELVGVFRIFQFVLVLVDYVPFGTDFNQYLFIQWVWVFTVINNSGSVI